MPQQNERVTHLPRVYEVQLQSEGRFVGLSIMSIPDLAARIFDAQSSESESLNRLKLAFSVGELESRDIGELRGYIFDMLVLAGENTPIDEATRLGIERGATSDDPLDPVRVFLDEVHIQSEEFLEALWDSEVIPVEFSPPEGRSLRDLAAGAGGTFYAAYEAAHSRPVLAILIAGGSIIVASAARIVTGAATGLSEGLKEGLREGVKARILHRLTRDLPGEAASGQPESRLTDPAEEAPRGIGPQPEETRSREEEARRDEEETRRREEEARRREEVRTARLQRALLEMEAASEHEEEVEVRDGTMVKDLARTFDSDPSTLLRLIRDWMAEHPDDKWDDPMPMFPAGVSTESWLFELQIIVAATLLRRRVRVTGRR